MPSPTHNDNSGGGGSFFSLICDEAGVVVAETGAVRDLLGVGSFVGKLMTPALAELLDRRGPEASLRLHECVQALARRLVQEKYQPLVLLYEPWATPCSSWPALPSPPGRR